jgi:hypothetical protein
MAILPRTASFRGGEASLDQLLRGTFPMVCSPGQAGRLPLSLVPSPTHLIASFFRKPARGRRHKALPPPDLPTLRYWRLRAPSLQVRSTPGMIGSSMTSLTPEVGQELLQDLLGGDEGEEHLLPRRPVFHLDVHLMEGQAPGSVKGQGLAMVSERKRPVPVAFNP